MTLSFDHASAAIEGYIVMTMLGRRGQLQRHRVARVTGKK
ncbi:hypothetical protein RIEGSTA812A_PEG_715 [invertebrate metagenome]|uniref:Uncharacterized protein n=1 Tax=invertebrate metagenome TaxID=1711999 RepID=A0A484HBR3_9ZZZZ